MTVAPPSPLALTSLPIDALVELLRQSDLDEVDLDLLEAEITRREQAAEWEPYPWQKPPRVLTTHELWLMMGGRGTGKTDGAAHYVNDHVNGPPCDSRAPGGHKVSLIAPRLSDALEAVTGVSGLRTYAPEIKVRESGPGGTLVTWPNNSRMRLFSCASPEDVESLRAGSANSCLFWWEEMAAIRRLEDARRIAIPALRLGKSPHQVASTTPRNVRAFRTVHDHKKTLLTHGRTREAWHLDETVRQGYVEEYAGTRWEAQELEGILLDDVEGALWMQEWIERTRVDTVPVTADPGHGLRYVCLALDPSDGRSDGDAQGWVLAALGWDHRLYVLASGEDRMTPDEWLRSKLMYAAANKATVVVEKEHGAGFLVRLIARVQAEHNLRHVPVVPVTTEGKGKYERAIAAALPYEQGLVSHVGLPATHAALESQLTSWTADTKWSPNALDALGHALKWLRRQGDGVGRAGLEHARTSTAPVVQPANSRQVAYASLGGFQRQDWRNIG